MNNNNGCRNVRRDKNSMKTLRFKQRMGISLLLPPSGSRLISQFEFKGAPGQRYSERSTASRIAQARVQCSCTFRFTSTLLSGAKLSNVLTSKPMQLQCSTSSYGNFPLYCCILVVESNGRRARNVTRQRLSNWCPATLDTFFVRR